MLYCSYILCLLYCLLKYTHRIFGTVKISVCQYNTHTHRYINISPLFWVIVRTEMQLCKISQLYIKELCVHAQVTSSSSFFSIVTYMDILREISVSFEEKWNFLRFHCFFRLSRFYRFFFRDSADSSINIQFISRTERMTNGIYILGSSENDAIAQQGIRSSRCNDYSGCSNFVKFQFVLSAIETRNSNWPKIIENKGNRSSLLRNESTFSQFALHTVLSNCQLFCPERNLYMLSSIKKLSAAMMIRACLYCHRVCTCQ